MLAIVMAAHARTRAPEIGRKMLMVAFLNYWRLPKARAAAFAHLHPPTDFASPIHAASQSAIGRTLCRRQIDGNTLDALCSFGRLKA
jgi:hypothetical protein